jgi:ribose transport system permease protein
MSVHEQIPARRAPLSRSVRTLMPYALLGSMVLVFFVLPLLSGKQATSFNVYDSLQLWSAYGLVALGVGLTMVAGEFDLSVLGVFAFCPMIAVKVGSHGWLLGIVAAVAIAAVIGLVEGLIISRLRINSMPVTLGFFIALLGATLTIGHSQSVPFSNLNIGLTLDTPKLQIFSLRSLIAIAVFAVVTLVMRYTHLGRDLRAIGGDRRASRTVGVEVDRVLVGVFVTSAVCASLGGVLLAYSFATALSDPGLSPLTFAVTACLIGGVSLVGGTGSAVGIAAGALTLSLLQELFSILAAPSYISSLYTGVLLVLATIVAAPQLSARWRSLRAPRAHRPGGLTTPSSPS